MIDLEKEVQDLPQHEHIIEITGIGADCEVFKEDIATAMECALLLTKGTHNVVTHKNDNDTIKLEYTVYFDHRIDKIMCFRDFLVANLNMLGYVIGYDKYCDGNDASSKIEVINLFNTSHKSLIVKIDIYGDGRNVEK